MTYFTRDPDLHSVDVYYARRIEDAHGVYLPIEKYRASAALMIDYDSIGELATQSHVTNILVDINIIDSQIRRYAYINASHVRLPQEYSFLLNRELMQ